MLNGQIDNESELVPSMETTLNTYWGDVSGTSIKNKEWLMDKFYPSMFTKGMIPEELFDVVCGVPVNTKPD